MRQPAGEPGAQAWEAWTLPLHLALSFIFLHRHQHVMLFFFRGACILNLARHFRQHSAHMRQPGVESGAQAWEACMLPLHYWRSCYQYVPLHAMQKLATQERRCLNVCQPQHGSEALVV